MPTVRHVYPVLRKWHQEHTARVIAAYPSDLEAYIAMLRRYAAPGSRILHLGCGWDRSGVAKSCLSACQVVGVDLDAASGDRYPGEFWHADAADLPFAPGTFDIACCEYVLEHVAQPDRVFSELARVLRKGGVFVFLTPSRWSYKSVVAAATPTAFHRFAAARLRPDARQAGDVFPTLYRANTESALSDLARRHGFSLLHLECKSNGPTWFRSMPIVFDAAHAYHRMIDRFEALAPLRCSLRGGMVRLEGPEAVTSSLVARCTRCRAADMVEETAGLRCPHCGNGYTKTGKRVETFTASAR